MSKSPNAFRSISEVAEELGVRKHVLRFWEGKFPQIRPMKRGGGRRYYRPEDLELLRGIRHLLHGDGYTIRGVQKILRERGVEAVKACGLGEAADLDKRAGAQPAAKTTGRRAGKTGRSAGRKTATGGKRQGAGSKDLADQARPVELAAEGKEDRPANTAQESLQRNRIAALAAVVKELEDCRAVLRGAGPKLQSSAKAAKKKTLSKARGAASARGSSKRRA